MEKRDSTLLLAVTGMSCAGCAATVERVLSHVTGVRQSIVDLGQGRVTVSGPARLVDLVAALEAAGYGARAWPAGPGAHSP